MSKDEREKAISMLPKDGFIRVGKPVEMASRDRVLLIRKANEMWQAGDITAAERIFVTVNYVDGLTRLGDYYYSKQDFIKALTYFKLAKDEQRVEAITLQMVQVIQQWLQE
ncbi:hypothetical protein [Entomospira culicis]|uniref:Uncharacterized protein n=1 Tax=Entomospira culicis TaxID=2719989 RepID=A0A968GFQ7_9SPIO|nr:hypothetical protein [Entomospira culicis]NIZ18756.1 hypothetical protein [Entomospira culicis]NIZ68971.1 hypothetical protein [Entomospira culicis]WDI37563.1 hypothetical protein PVA46_01890 [Entomospira culicis]WDI39191.1 hypothetical protein PVA47_01895 [Entomospira culicis]